jgi:hypothetical protein
MSSATSGWGGVVGEAGGAPLDVPPAPFLVGWDRPARVGLDGVEAVLGDLDQDQVGGDHSEQDQEEAERQGGKPEEASERVNGRTAPTSAHKTGVTSISRLGRLRRNGTRLVRITNTARV